MEGGGLRITHCSTSSSSVLVFRRKEEEEDAPRGDMGDKRTLVVASSGMWIKPSALLGEQFVVIYFFATDTSWIFDSRLCPMWVVPLTRSRGVKLTHKESLFAEEKNGEEGELISQRYILIFLSRNVWRINWQLMLQLIPLPPLQVIGQEAHPSSSCWVVSWIDKGHRHHWLEYRNSSTALGIESVEFLGFNPPTYPPTPSSQGTYLQVIGNWWR